jgi:hypothetical protein
MKTTTKLFFVIALLAVLAWPHVALAQGQQGDKYVLGGTYTLASGETLNGNLFVFGGIATLENGSQVNGDVMLAGGTLRVSGEIQGNIVATGGLISLNSTAVVTGDVNTIAANLERASGARVDGKVNSGTTGPIEIPGIPGVIRVPEAQSLRFITSPIVTGFWYFFRSFLWAALAVLVSLFLHRQTERVAQAMVAQPLIAGGIGLLTTVVFPLLLILIAITLIGIPVSFLGAILLVIAWGFGVIAVGTEVGKRIAKLLQQEWALAVSAGIGTFILTLVVNGIGFIRCVGWVAPAIVGMLGLGAVILTRFGTQSYPPYATVVPAAPVPDWPPAPPAPPAATPRSDTPLVPEIPPVAPEAQPGESTGEAQEAPPDEGA